jgi:hypothetical protein
MFNALVIRALMLLEFNDGNGRRSTFVAGLGGRHNQIILIHRNILKKIQNSFLGD